MAGSRHRSLPVSILLPVRDGVHATLRCLETLAASIDEDAVAFEVIAVDNASSDGTDAALQGIGGDFRLLRNEVDHGLTGALAQAAAEARGELIVMMGTHHLPRPGWLEALIERFDADDDLAAARPRHDGETGWACTAVRSATLSRDSTAATLTAVERALQADAPVVDAAVVDVARPIAAEPMTLQSLPHAAPLGAYLATRLEDRHGAVVFSPDAGHAIAELSPSAGVALVADALDDAQRADLAQRCDLHVAFVGTAMRADHARVPLTILDRWPVAAAAPAPDGFRVVAIVTAYNEGDVIAQTVAHLLEQGVDVHLLDNWSSDGTYELVRDTFTDGRVAVERFPADGPSSTYDWESILSRVDEIGAGLHCDWVIHQDADELRESPWPGVDLRSALHHVQSAGFNCVDHTVLNFRPVDDLFPDRGGDVDAHFRFCEFPDHQANFMQMKAWRQNPRGVALALEGGHRAHFEGRHTFPYKFLMRHYPLRSQRHGERKVLRDRRSRWNAAERARGWHVHYDAYTDGSSFLWDPRTLLTFDRDRFMRDHLISRISGVDLGPGALSALVQAPPPLVQEQRPAA